VGNPLSALMPAPVRTKTRSDAVMEMDVMAALSLQLLPNDNRILETTTSEL